MKAACQWCDISPQAHYQMLKRREQRLLIEALVLAQVLEIRQELPRLGGRKLLYLLSDFLVKHDIAMGRDRFFNLLGRYGLLIHVKRKPTRTTFPGGIRSENLLVSLDITRPNQVVVADITYITTAKGFLYLALVTDLYSRKILGWDLSNSLSLEGALRAMKRAIQHIQAAGGQTKEMIHHSDHGVQYTSRDYQKLLRNADIRSSMGAVGNAYDNAVAERVNGILKLEFLLDQRFPDTASARKATAQAVAIYNAKRPHLSLNYQTPSQVYQQALQRQKEGLAGIAEPPLKAPDLSRVDGSRLAAALDKAGAFKHYASCQP